MVSFVPFHLSALEKSPEIYDWVSSWADEVVLLLKPEDWFGQGHDCDGGKLRLSLKVMTNFQPDGRAFDYTKIVIICWSLLSAIFESSARLMQEKRGQTWRTNVIRFCWRLLDI